MSGFAIGATSDGVAFGEERGRATAKAKSKKANGLRSSG
jgi:hypothetical protein